MSWPFTLQHPHLVNFITKSTHAVHDTIGFLFWLAQGKYSWSAARHQGDVGSTTEHSLFDFLDKWFAFDGNVNLKVDKTYGQSWSLAIGSQFKPLPTSSEVRSDIYKDPNTDAFKTFAQVLVRQNEFFSKLQNTKEQNNDKLI